MLPIAHGNNCAIHAAPDGEYVSDDDCDCGAVARWYRLRIAALESALDEIAAPHGIITLESGAIDYEDIARGFAARQQIAAKALGRSIASEIK